MADQVVSDTLQTGAAQVRALLDALIAGMNPENLELGQELLQREGNAFQNSSRNEWQGRYSFRQELRTPETPHLARQGVDRTPRSLALEVLVDRSGSMDPLNDDVRLSLMTFWPPPTWPSRPGSSTSAASSATGRLTK